MPNPGNDLNLGTPCGSDKPLVLSRRDRARHTYAVGSTRTGKTKFLELMGRQDMLQHPRSNSPIVVIDPHGTLHDSLIGYCAAENLKHLPIVPVDLRRSDTVISYNMLRRRQGIDLSVVCVALVTAILHSWGQLNTNDTPRLATWLYALLMLAVEKDYTLIEVLHLLRDPVIRRDMVAQVEHFVARTTFETVARLNEREFQERVESTLYRLNRFISSQLIRAMLCQKTGETLDLGRVLDEGKILLVCLSTEGTQVSEEDAATLGSVLLTDLWIAAKRRGKREEGGLRPAYIYLDEFQNYVTPVMAKGLAEASGFGLHFTLAHQFPSQLSDQGDLGKMVLSSVLANAKNKIVFQLSHPEDLELLASILYRQDVDPDQIKDEVYSTKVLGHALRYLPSFSFGTTRGTERGWQTTRGTGESYTVGSNWTHTDTTSDSLTASDGRVDGTTEGLTLTEESSLGEGAAHSVSDSLSLGESRGSSASRGESDSSSSGTTTTQGKNWSRSRGKTSGGSSSEGQGRSDTYRFGELNEDLQEELRRYEFTKLDRQGRKEFKRLWPGTQPMTQNEIEAFRRRRVEDYSLAENGSSSDTENWGDSSTASSGGNSGTAQSRSNSHGTSTNRGETQGTSRSESAGKARSQSTSASQGRARGFSTGSNAARTHSDSKTHGTSFSDAFGGSEAHSTQVSHSEAESESESEAVSHGLSLSPMLMPIMGRELSSRQFRSVQEQLFSFAQILDGLPDRHCVVRLASMRSPVQLYTRTVRAPLSTAQRISGWTLQRLSALPFTMERAEAIRRVTERESAASLRSLDTPGLTEPSTARRPLPRVSPCPPGERTADIAPKKVEKKETKGGQGHG